MPGARRSWVLELTTSIPGQADSWRESQSTYLCLRIRPAVGFVVPPTVTVATGSDSAGGETIVRQCMGGGRYARRLQQKMMVICSLCWPSLRLHQISTVHCSRRQLHGLLTLLPSATCNFTSYFWRGRRTKEESFEIERVEISPPNHGDRQCRGKVFLIVFPRSVRLREEALT